MDSGQRQTFEGEPLDKNSKNYWEILSLHGVPVPSSWSGFLASCQEDGVYFLAMRQEKEQWQAAINGQTIFYNKALGLWAEK